MSQNKKHFRLKRSLIFGVSLIVLVSIVALGISSYKPRKDDLFTVKMGYLPITACLPYFAGENQDYFKDEGIKVEPVRFEASKDMMDALLQGQVDVVTSAASSLAFIVDEKTPDQFKVFGINTNGTENPLNVLMVKANSPITSVSELKGKKIGSFPGIQATTLLKRYLRSQGLDPEKDVQIQEIKQELHLQALDSGQIDAILTYEPNATIAKTRGIAKVLAYDPFSQVSVNPYPTGVFAVSEKFLEAHPTEARRFITAHDEAMEYTDSHQTEARALLPKFFPIDTETALLVPLSKNETHTKINTGAFQKFADVFLEEGVIKHKVDVSKMLYR